MKSWLTSLSATLAFAATTFVIFLGYTFISALVLGKWNLQTSMASIGALVVVILTGVWLWALLFILRGYKGALIIALILSLLNVLAGASDILVFCPTPCQGYFPLAEIWHWLMVISGLGAAILVIVQLKQATSRVKK